jgi:hypothetical protein
MTVTEASTIAKPVTSAASGMKSGSAAQNVDRVSGTISRLSGRTTASITSIVTRFVATTVTGSSCRGRRTCLTRLACRSRLGHDIWIADWKKTQTSRPVSRKSG